MGRPARSLGRLGERKGDCELTNIGRRKDVGTPTKHTLNMEQLAGREIKIAIVGSREWSPRDRDRAQRSVVAFVNTLPADAIVISGGAEGVDTWAETAAKARGLKFKSHGPSKYLPTDRAPTFAEKREALFARNTDIANECDVGAALISADRKKGGGTRDTVGKIQAQNKLCVEIPFIRGQK